MPTTRYYPKQIHASLTAWYWDFIKWMINDPTAALTGPNWEMVQAFDGSFAPASKREVPADPHDVSTFSAGFCMTDGVFTNGDWMVLRSAAGVCGNSTELYIELDSPTAIKWLLIPYDNFNPAAPAETTPPTMPTDSIGSALGSAGLISMTGWTTGATYSANADEAMVAVLFDDNTTPAWIYAGEVEPAGLAGVPADDRPFVIWDTPASVFISNTNSYFNRISPLDDATACTTGYSSILTSSGGAVTSAGSGGGFLGLWGVYPIGVHFYTASHIHFAGFLRNVGCTSTDKGTSGTLIAKNWMYRLNGGAYGPVCFAWDGATDYP
jgi:hypothetical protein